IAMTTPAPIVRSVAAITHQSVALPVTSCEHNGDVPVSIVCDVRVRGAPGGCVKQTCATPVPQQALASNGASNGASIDASSNGWSPGRTPCWNEQAVAVSSHSQLTRAFTRTSPCYAVLSLRRGTISSRPDAAG